jgi:DNA mismatch repair protein MutL
MERKSIQQLPQSLVNRIAAGEVIERPASVVKELVDNAIDAGATQIIVEIEDGGRELVRVIDDGSGIASDELVLAFAPHATSKLRDDEDLFRIQTMGFRGEALASIGSVSHARILSRVASSDAAYELTNRGGELSDIQAAAGNVGTTIEIRNLFFNTPARRKFLKGTQTELGHITEMVMRLALAQPGIGFRLIHNGRVSREYAPTSLPERLLCAWPDDFREQRLPLDTRDAEIKLTGIIGLPELATPTQKYQHLYVNGRPIRDKSVTHALREAYRGLTEPGRHPAAIVLIDMPPGDVDVNVHPTKSEVRFKDSNRIHGLVMSSVRQVLLGNDLTPRATPRSAEVPEAERRSLQEKLAGFFRQSPSPGESGSSAIDVPARDAGFTWTPPRPMPLPRLPEAFSLRSQQTQSAMEYAVAPDRPVEPAHAPGLTGAERGSSLSPDPQTRKNAIQLHNSYLVVESSEGMVIIDQHALHERIIYEDLLAKVTNGPLESQRMLIPQTVRASARQIDLLEQIAPMLAKLGIEAEPFGPETVAVQAFPSFLDRLDPGLFVQELLEKGEQELLDMNAEELLHDVLDMMACKAAIKAGDPLTPQEIEALLARRELVERSSNCPHGRPTTLKLSISDLEKQFKRTGF